jgi:ATP-dependent HslUV protease ATP-binding subunit HslU
MVRDLVENAIQLVRAEHVEAVKVRAAEHAEERIVAAIASARGIVKDPPQRAAHDAFGPILVTPPPGKAVPVAAGAAHGEIRDELRAGRLEDEEIEIEVSESHNPFMQIFGAHGMEEMELNLKEMLGSVPGMRGGKPKRRRAKVGDARRVIEAEEAQRLVDQDRVTREAIERTEQNGIIFIDEIDKVAGRQTAQAGPDVSREGVQRDLLPIVEGSTVSTKYGPVKTDHVLFIAAGAFHVSKPSDLIPELQGRFPIRVELESLGVEDFVRILTEPKNALTKQYAALLATEGVTLSWTADAVRAVAEYAADANDRAENIGARRLHTILEALLDELAFGASELGDTSVTIDGALVKKTLDPIVSDADLAKYVL